MVAEIPSASLSVADNNVPPEHVRLARRELVAKIANERFSRLRAAEDRNVGLRKDAAD